MVSRVPSLVVAGLLVGTHAAAQDVNLASGGAESTWRGTAANAVAGASLDQGDVSGDGRRDLILGAPGNGSSPGKVYVIFGGPIRRGDLSLTSAQVVINGGTGPDRFGTATAAGNIRTAESSDQPRDIAIGAPGAAGGNGIVYLFASGSGMPNGVRNATVAGGATGYAFQILGRTGDRLGAALATADVNNDGFREIIIGAPGTSRVYIINGRSLTLGSTIDLATTPALAEITVAGITGADRLGNLIAAGDINGDSFYDILISAPFEDAAAGRVYLLAGSATGMGGAVDLSVSASAVFTGVAAGDQAGTGLASPDFDGDGKKDIVIGSPTADPGGRLNAGAVYVIFGRTSLPSRNLSAADTTFWGEAAGSQTGANVVMGAINRDTPDDLVMLAFGARGGFGELQMYYGGPRATRTGIIDLALGMPRRLFAQPSEGSIRTAAVFEVTGEGARDIIVGIPTANGTAGVNNGLVYFSPSPRMILNKHATTVRALRGAPSSSTLRVSNPGIGTVTWTASVNVPWLTVSPANGQSSALSPGMLTITSGPAFVGRRSATVTLRSTSVDLTMTTTVAVTVVCCQPKSDYDGDSADDLVLFRPSNGNWMMRTSSTGFTSGPSLAFGAPTDKPVPGDYDGDGRIDMAVYRPSNGIWYVIYAATGVMVQLQWGIDTDVPMPADFTGDGRTDLCVWRPSNGVWYIYDLATASFTSRQWGISTDIPLTGDYDGDGLADVAAFRPANGYWYVFFSSNQIYAVYQWGVSTDIPVPADYNGDGRTDLAVYRPSNGNWFVYDLTLNNYASYQWGVPTDIPAPKDYDGDGRTDLAIWRPSTNTWFVYYLGSATFQAITYGSSSDVVVR
jgi:hypothetical protein